MKIWQLVHSADAANDKKEANQAGTRSKSASIAIAVNRQSQKKSTALGRSACYHDQETTQKGMIICDAGDPTGKFQVFRIVYNVRAASRRF